MSTLRIGLGELKPATRHMLTAKHLGQKVTITITGNVSQIGAEMVDVSSWDGLAYVCGEEHIELLVTLVELA